MQEFVRPKIFDLSSGKVASPNSLVADFDANHRISGQIASTAAANSLASCKCMKYMYCSQLIAINWNEKIN